MRENAVKYLRVSEGWALQWKTVHGIQHGGLNSLEGYSEALYLLKMLFENVIIDPTPRVFLYFVDSSLFGGACLYYSDSDYFILFPPWHTLIRASRDIMLTPSFIRNIYKRKEAKHASSKRFIDEIRELSAEATAERIFPNTEDPPAKPRPYRKSCEELRSKKREGRPLRKSREELRTVVSMDFIQSSGRVSSAVPLRCYSTSHSTLVNRNMLYKAGVNWNFSILKHKEIFSKGIKLYCVTGDMKFIDELWQQKPKYGWKINTENKFLGLFNWIIGCPVSHLQLDLANTLIKN